MTAPRNAVSQRAREGAETVRPVSHAAVYLLAPGGTSFLRYTDADGLHLANAGGPGIMNVAGGRAGEAFVGYNSADVSGLPQLNGDPAHDATLRKGGLD